MHDDYDLIISDFDVSFSCKADEFSEKNYSVILVEQLRFKQDILVNLLKDKMKSYIKSLLSHLKKSVEYL